MPGDPFYYSKAWRELRLRALRRARYRCQHCHAHVIQSGGARIDHVIPRKQAPELALQITNVRVLCPRCDNRRHAEKVSGEPGTVARADLGAANADGIPTHPTHHWNKKP